MTHRTKSKHSYHGATSRSWTSNKEHVLIDNYSLIATYNYLSDLKRLGQFMKEKKQEMTTIKQICWGCVHCIRQVLY